MNRKRLFFAFKVTAPWPPDLPQGRLLEEGEHHLTVAFLGNADYDEVQPLLHAMPRPAFHVGVTGFFDKVAFLPPAHPRVVAWHVHGLGEGLESFVDVLQTWLQDKGVYQRDKRLFLPHVTLCRAPFHQGEWQHHFSRLPLYVEGLHLYESLGNLRYASLWSHQLLPPFEELDHTADIAFKVRGSSIGDLVKNAFHALAWRYVSLLDYGLETWRAENLDEVIALLNGIIAAADADRGCPFKAVSYHGEIEKEPDEILCWEMIVDV